MPKAKVHQPVTGGPWQLKWRDLQNLGVLDQTLSGCCESPPFGSLAPTCPQKSLAHLIKTAVSAALVLSSGESPVPSIFIVMVLT